MTRKRSEKQRIRDQQIIYITPDLTKLKKIQEELDQIDLEINSRFDKGRNWLGSSREKNLLFQRKTAWENKLAGEAHRVYNERMARIKDIPDSKTRGTLTRKFNELPDSGSPPPDSIIKSAGEKRIEVRDYQQNVDAIGAKTAQGRGSVGVHYGHAKAVAGDKMDYIAKPHPLNWSYRPPSKEGDPIKKHIQVRQRGADTGKSVYAQSARMNVHIGPNDSFSLTQMEDIGRPKNWGEAIAFDDAFQDRNMIDIDPIDWMRLEQKDITTEALVWHKQRVTDLAAQNDIFLDALGTEDGLRVVDYRRGQASIRKHEWGLDDQGKQIPGGLSAKGRDFKQRTWELGPKRITENTPIQRLKPGEGLKIGLSKATGRLSRVEAFTMLGANLASGNVPGAVINAGMISGKLLAESPAVQKRFAELAVRMVQERSQKTAMKMIPGVDILLSGAEAWDYAVQGRWDQATLATISGAIGWAGPVGDLAAAFIDMTNTTISISRGDFSSVEKKEKAPEIVDSNINQRRLVEAMGRDIKQSTRLGKIYRMSK